MGISIGPKIVSDGLVLYLDSGNLNSYPGEPTINLSYVADNQLDWTSTWNNSGLATWNTNDTTISKPFISDYNVVSMSKDTAGNSHLGVGTCATTTSTEYTVSTWFWQNRTGGGSVPYCRPQPHNTNQGVLTYKGSANWNEWPQNKWIRISKTYTTPSVDVSTMYISSYLNDAGDKIAYYCPQIEQKSYMTNFTGPQRTNTSWYDLIRNRAFEIDSTGIVHDSFNGTFDLADGGITNTDNITTSTTCTCIFWMKTTDEQALFLTPSIGGYLGAYRVGNKKYDNNCGTPVFYMDTIERGNIYDYIIDGEWHMLEFKSVNLNGWDIKFNKYGSYTFGNGSIASFMIYDRNLTSSESLQLYNNQKSRFGK